MHEDLTVKPGLTKAFPRKAKSDEKDTGSRFFLVDKGTVMGNLDMNELSKRLKDENRPTVQDLCKQKFFMDGKLHIDLDEEKVTEMKTLPDWKRNHFCIIPLESEVNLWVCKPE